MYWIVIVTTGMMLFFVEISRTKALFTPLFLGATPLRYVYLTWVETRIEDKALHNFLDFWALRTRHFLHTVEVEIGLSPATLGQFSIHSKFPEVKQMWVCICWEYPGFVSFLGGSSLEFGNTIWMLCDIRLIQTVPQYFRARCTFAFKQWQQET